MSTILRKLIISLCLCMTTLTTSAQSITSSQKQIPFAEFGVKLPLNLTMPADYVQVKRFEAMGVTVFCAKEDESQLKDGGDFSSAKRAIITIRPSPSDFYDETRKVFSFESLETREQLKASGATDYLLNKLQIRDVPVAAMTFNVGKRKVYSLAISAGTILIRLSYNVRSEPREVDDRVWSELISGL